MAVTWKWKVEELSEIKKRLDLSIIEAIRAGMGEWSEDISTESVSRTRLQGFIDDGHLSINDSIARSKSSIKIGDLLTLNYQAPALPSAIPQKGEVDILFEDDHIIAVNKRTGVIVHPSETCPDETLVNHLLFLGKTLCSLGGETRPGVVHRIDRYTSGVMILSKSEKAHTNLIDIFSNHRIHRVYWALTYAGNTPLILNKKLSCNTSFGRDIKDRKKMSCDVPKGKHAISHFQVLEKFSHPGHESFSALVEATLETGRTHQIRVHLNHMGNSVMGDPVYGKPSPSQNKWKSLPSEVMEGIKALPGQALHARTLEFDHPVTGEKMKFEAALPKNFTNLLKILREFKDEYDQF